MNVILTEPSRIDKLKAWLAMHRITYAVLGGYLGMCAQRVCLDIINSDFAPTRRVVQLRELGVPEELLPTARDRRPGKKAKKAPPPAWLCKP